MIIMLHAESPWWQHAAQNGALILLSLALLPLNTFLLLLSRVVCSLRRKNAQAGVQHNPHPKTILVTGVGMTKGLTLARAFYLAGHRVIGADFELSVAPSPARYSAALARFYSLPSPSKADHSGRASAPYVQAVLHIVLTEKVDLWVSCSGVASAIEDGEAKEAVEEQTNCRAIQFDVATTQMLHDKHTFIQHTRVIGLTVPETHTITSRDAVSHALRKAPAGRKYIMKTIGMDDAARGNIMTLLPKETPEETDRYLSKLRISEQSSWILQQFVRGDEYCTHSLVVQGQVKAFVACPSSDLLMHYQALPPESALSQAMLKFTETYARHGGNSFTGHLSFDFLVEDSRQSLPDNVTLYPIECNPRAHTAVCLFNGTPRMVDGYLALLNDKTASSADAPVTPLNTKKYYWMGNDVVVSVLYPFWLALTLYMSPWEALRKLMTAVGHFATWKDGTYEAWDPLPFFVLYQVYWPWQFLTCLVSQTKWSRINVSTLKVFKC